MNEIHFFLFVIYLSLTIVDYIKSSVVTRLCFLQHERFVQECKDAEPDVLFVGDSMVQLMQQFEVRIPYFNIFNML